MPPPYTPNYPVAAMPITPQPDPMAVTDQMSQIVNKAIPGYNGLSAQSSNIVGNLMGGLPSAAPTQRANAYFGANSGMPGSDFVRNRGFDLYGQQAEQYKQRGFDDFLKLLSGESGTVMPTTGQQIQSGQFGQDLAQRQREANQRATEFNADYALKKNANQDPIWNSSDTGQMYTRSGLSAGYDPNFDNASKFHRML